MSTDPDHLLDRSTALDEELVTCDDASGAVCSDAQLVERIRQGDHEAFSTLMLRYERRLRRLIRRFIRSPETADDLVQETYLRVFQRMDQFDTSRRFGPWLFRIGVNLTLDFLRKKRRRIRWMLFSQRRDAQPVDPPAADPRKQIDLRQEIEAVLEQIPEKYRVVLVLRDLENFPISEIAAITKRREGTIRWRLFEARQMFHDLWTERQQRWMSGRSGGDAMPPGDAT